MSTTFDKIRLILYNQFGFHYDQIQSSTKLELELGMDSREMFELLGQLELSFKITINFDEIDLLIEEKNSIIIQDIVDYVDKKQKI